MKVLIAIDSFKGCMSSKEAGRACAEGIWRARPRAETVVMPMADGGEGTMDAIVEGLKGEYVECRTAGPYGSEVTARYGVVNKRKAAVIEAAQATGLVLVERLGLGIGLNPWKATTRGVGQMILHAAERGCRDFVIGTGGSAATEGGIGMLEALGCAFYGADGQRLPAELASLAKIGRIDRSGMAGVLRECYFRIACDVKNPLCGKNGAVNVFGAQRGVKAEEKGFLDAAMFHFADKTLECTGKDYRGRAGSGAAGGLGFAFMSYLPHVELVSGVDLMLQTIGLEKKLKGAQVYALEWKYDGISCSLVYQDGRLISAATRGDKDCGQDLLAHVMRMPSVPQYINMTGRVEVRGEIVCPKAELTALGYKDCRTAAAALTNQAVPSREVERLVFLAWQMDSDKQPFGTESASIVTAQQQGFQCDVRTCDSADVCRVLDEYSDLRESLPYPTDGVVIKIDDKTVAASLGYTEHHPKGNIAYKFGAQKTVTRVLRIEVSVGATGKRTPVAYLEPVMIMGREVKQASLYSERKMTELGVTEGCTVEVGLSNDVTPKIYRVIETATETTTDNTDCTDDEPLTNNRETITNNREPSAIGRQTSSTLKAIGMVAAATVALFVIYETGLLIPLGLIGLATGGILK